MKQVRLGIVGAGTMGSNYIRDLSSGKVKEVLLSAVADIQKEKLEHAKEISSVPIEVYEDPEDMFEKADLDAVLIAVPHYLHPPLAESAFRHGLHVLVEKPAGVYTLQVKEMNEAARKSGKVFGMMFNQRTDPVYRKVREMIRNNELGELKRVVWIITNWYRSQSYYDSGSWRATWKGEGGGVLQNQCPHNLDLLQWIVGMPSGVRAFMKYGKGRNIEVENDVTAYLEFPNGATGLFVTSTHETPGTNRLEISGDQGKIVVEDGKILFYRNKVSEKEFNETWTKGFGQPEYEVIEVEPDPVEGLTQHMAIIENFASAILRGTSLIAEGTEGIREVSLANAMYLSDWTGQFIDPSSLDDERFYSLLEERIIQSKEKEVKEKALDVSGTFNSAKQ